MIVVALDGAGRPLKADVVEAGKRGSSDVLDSVIWDQEVFLAQTSTQLLHNLTDLPS